MYLARQLTGKSLKQIGEYFGGRDHTTVMHGCRKTEDLIQNDPSTRHAVVELRQGLAMGALACLISEDISAGDTYSQRLPLCS